MLDDFNLEQNIAYKTLINSVKNNKLSHAYLIETNGYSKSLDFAVAFAKYILCPHHYNNSQNCNGCHQCENINKNEFLELKIIDPDGQWIKKSQLEELQEEFSKKSIIGDKKVYIINKAEKLNVSSSNSLLKFLEEPEEGIIAILLTENKNQLLNTIISRCQNLSLKKQNNLDNLSTFEKISHLLNNNIDDINNYILDENNKIKLEKVIEFIEYYESNHENTIIYINKLWHDYFKERTEIYNSFTIMLFFYKDLLNDKLNRKITIFNENLELIKKINKKNDISSITSKINVIMDLREKIKFNANANLLMDKLIIELERCENYDRSSRSNI